MTNGFWELEGALMNPEEYRKKTLEQSNKEIQELNSKTSKLCAEQEKQTASRITELETKIKKSSSIVSGFAILGFIASIVVFIYPMNSNPVFVFCAPGVVFFIVLVCGLAIQKYQIFSWRKEIARIKALNEEKMQQYIDSRDEQIAAIQKQSLESAEEQKISYEKERRAESVKFTNSSVANEIITMVSDGFKGEIDSSDRRPHIQQIVVPLCIEVYADRVKTPYGVFDFEIERVANLTSEEEQAALANAIAQSIQTEILTEYPEDILGGEVAPMEIEIEYRLSAVRVSMTYSAVNAAFVPERSF